MNQKTSQGVRSSWDSALARRMVEIEGEFLLPTERDSNSSTVALSTIYANRKAKESIVTKRVPFGELDGFLPSSAYPGNTCFK